MGAPPKPALLNGQKENAAIKTGQSQLATNT